MACHLCGKISENIFHIIHDCQLVSTIWRDLTPIPIRFHPAQPDKEEQAFGIVHAKPPTRILVRNWLTFLIRSCISKMERQAHYCTSNIISRTRKKIQHCIEKELDKKHFVSSNDGTIKKFEETFAYRNIICRTNPDGKYTVTKFFFQETTLSPLLNSLILTLRLFAFPLFFSFCNNFVSCLTAHILSHRHFSFGPRREGPMNSALSVS